MRPALRHLNGPSPKTGPGTEDLRDGLDVVRMVKRSGHPCLVPGFGAPELVQPDEQHPADNQQTAEELDNAGQFAQQKPRPDDGEEDLGERDEEATLVPSARAATIPET